MKKQILKRILCIMLVMAMCISMLIAGLTLFGFDAEAASVSASYSSTSDLLYRADGTLTITSSSPPSYYRLYWGNSSGGKLSGYAAFRDISSSGSTTTYTFPKYSFVPEGATKILVYSVSGGSESWAASVDLGKDSDMGTPDKEVQLISDIHVQSSIYHTYSQRFANALADIKSISPNSQGIFISGDIADGDVVADPNKWTDMFPEQYDNYRAIVADSGLGSIMNPMAGNHDFFADGDCVAQFLNGTGLNSMYYYKDIGGTRFIMMGNAGINDNRVIFASGQLQWLREKLASAPDGPVFVLCHNAFKNTVAGTRPSEYPGEIFYGTESDSELKSILAQYPNAIFVSGHSHERLELPNTLYSDGSLTALNAAGVSYVVEHGGTLIGISQGFFLYFYGNTVVIKGYDFTNNRWIPEAQFVLGEEKASLGSPEFVGKNFYAQIYNSSENTNLVGNDSDASMAYPTANWNQIWQFVQFEGNAYKIINRLNGKCLANNGTAIELQDDNGSDSQRWYLYPYSDGHIISPKNATENALDIVGWDTSLVQSWEILKTPDQIFNIKFVPNQSESGMKFTEEQYYSSVKSIDRAPRTFEATVRFPSNMDPEQRGGVILGDLDENASNNATICFEVHKNGHPRLYLKDTSNISYDFIFDEVNVYNGQKTHITIVVDGVNVYCYINGFWQQTLDRGDAVLQLNHSPMSLGGDNRSGGNEQYFKGELFDAALYYDVRTDAEVLSDATAAPGLAGLMMYYQVSASSTMPSSIEDLSGNGFKQAANFAFTEDTVNSAVSGNGMTFTEENYYTGEYALEIAPNTFEATVRFPSNMSASERGGVILGNYGDNYDAISFEIHQNGNPRLYLQVPNGSSYDAYDFKFTDVNVYNGEKTHIAIVLDTYEVRCYINGVLKQTLDRGRATVALGKEPLSLGGDNRSGGNAQYFKGEIFNVALYSDVRTQAEISNDKNNYGTSSLIMCYATPASVAGQSTISDISGNGYTLNANGHTHSFSTLNHDANNHWYECACGEKQNVVGHSGGTATCKEQAICGVCNAAYGSKKQQHTYVHVAKVDATCISSGMKEHYYCQCWLDGSKQYFDTNKEIVGSATLVIAKDTNAHSYGTPSYVWSADNKTCTATRVCAHNSAHKETQTVNSLAVVSQAQTCVKEELTTYTATFTNAAFAKQTKANVKTKDAKGHTYGNLVAKVNATCSKTGLDAHYRCNCGQYFTSAKVAIAYNDLIIAINANAHSYGTPSYAWSSDNKTCTATRICAHNSAHKETQTVNSSSVVSQAQTCVKPELTTYTATFTNAAFAKQTKANIKTQDAQGHDFDGGAWIITDYYNHWKKCSRCTVEDTGNKAAHKYTYTTSNGKHKGTCVGCGKTYTNDCSGGVATCTEKAVCIACRKPYGTTDANNHSFSSRLTKGATTHYYECTRTGCTAKKDETAHKYENYTSIGNNTHMGTCVCTQTETKSCSGGSATCQAKAVCTTCGESYGSLGTHNYDLTAWGYKADGGHAHKCKTAGCDEHDTVQAHVSSGVASEFVAESCTECEFVITPATGHSHTQASTWSSNSSYHWKECTGCSGQEFSKGIHVYGNNCDTSCNTCGYIRQITHDYKLKQNADEHWQECSVCNAEKSGSRNKHNGGSAGCENKALCIVCETAYGETLPHDYAWVITDANEHWKACVDCEAEESGSRSEHGYDDYTFNGNDTHTSKCKCGRTDTSDCAGGVASCTTQAKCEKCQALYGDLDEINHTGNSNELKCNNNGTHDIVWSCCKAVATENVVCTAVNADNSCLTEEKCACGYVISAEKSAHEYSGACDKACNNAGCTAGNRAGNGKHTGADANDCTAGYVCSVCGENVAGAIEHTSNNANDTDCTADSICTVCNKVLVEGESSHNYAGYESNGDDTHTGACSRCGVPNTEPCSGGEAGCTEAALCEVCETAYGEAAGHKYDDQNDTDCNVCGEVKFIPGDLDCDDSVDLNDVIYLMMHTYFPEDYPLEQDVDYDDSDSVDLDDVIYLMMHTYFPEEYPLVRPQPALLPAMYGKKDED